MPLGYRRPVVLEGRYLTLEPVVLEDAAELSVAARSPEIWQFMRYGPGDTEPAMRELIQMFLDLEQRGTDLPFALRLRPERRLVGMTRFLGIDRANRTVEVGGTWLDRSYWRTPLNTDSKRQMLGYAFEVEGTHRVQIKTDTRNVRSQRAIERLGAVKEGVERDHLILRDGYVRSSVIYSILAREWPEVKARLDAQLHRPWEGAVPAHR